MTHFFEDLENEIYEEFQSYQEVLNAMIDAKILAIETIIEDIEVMKW